MANAERGEVSVTARNRVYTLRPSFNALCALDELTGKSLDVMFGAIREGRLSGLRAVVWCLLQDEHADTIKTLQDCGDWIEDAGLDVVMAAVAKVVTGNAPAGAERASENPPEAQAGTGEGATAVPVGSA